MKVARPQELYPLRCATILVFGIMIYGPPPRHSGRLLFSPPLRPTGPSDANPNPAMSLLFTAGSVPVRLLALFFCGLLTTPLAGQLELSGRANRQLQEMVEFNETFLGGHTGFVLYDLDYQTYLYGLNADRRFVPASNVKLITYYVAQRLLGQRAPGLVYQEYTDRIDVWGAGYPLLLHPEFATVDEVFPWLRSRQKPLRLHFPEGRGQGVERYGAGWSWDDYNDAYVYERSALPVFGNRLFLELSQPDAEGRRFLLGAPLSVAGRLREDQQQTARIRRSEYGNEFTVAPGFMERARFPLERPLHLDARMITNELAAALPERPVSQGQLPYPHPETAQTLPVTLPDTIYRRMLQQSDNFLAEQLLIQSAVARYGRPDVPALLDYATDSLLLPLGVEGVRWADGSGLSRYNLFSPRQFVRVLFALDQEVGRERLLQLLPAGGVSGTLENRFDNRPDTYVWAKTGSLSGVACVSGLLRTRKGRWLVFSFMHNNFTERTSAYYREMERTLGWCYDNL